MTFDDYLLKQDHIGICYRSLKPLKRVLSLDGLDLKDVYFIQYLKYDAKKDELVLHREDGVAEIIYSENGSRYCCCWCQNDEKHRLDGPAVIYYNKDGSIIRVEYWIKGIEYNKDKYLIKVARYKLKK